MNAKQAITDLTNICVNAAQATNHLSDAHQRASMEYCIRLIMRSWRDGVLLESELDECSIRLVHPTLDNDN